ncbi:MAG: tetratricopeptide repeat protein [Pseudomonadota bacterium]
MIDLAKPIRTAALLFVVSLITGNAVVAEDTQPASAMSETVYTGLKQAQDLLEAKSYGKSLKILKDLRQQALLSDYEVAQIWNLTAYAFYLQGKYKASIKAYDQVLAQEELPEGIIQSTLRTQAQLYFEIENYNKALEVANKLLNYLAEPSAEIYMLIGQAYFQLGQFADALEPIKKAIGLQKQAGLPPRENWLVLLRVIYYELEDFPNLIATLKTLIQYYPKERYLVTLASAYSEVGQSKKQLAVAEALHELGYNQEPAQIRNLANLYLLHEVPYKAAKVLQSGIDGGAIKGTEKNLKLLSQAWFQARHDNKAIPPLERAATLAADGDLYVRLAQSYLNVGRWTDAAEAAAKGIKKGGLKHEDTAQLIRGMALLNEQRFKPARAAFAEAARFTRSKKAARSWIAFVDAEIERFQARAQTVPTIAPLEQDRMLQDL